MNAVNFSLWKLAVLILYFRHFRSTFQILKVVKLKTTIEMERAFIIRPLTDFWKYIADIKFRRIFSLHACKLQFKRTPIQNYFSSFELWFTLSIHSNLFIVSIVIHWDSKLIVPSSSWKFKGSLVKSRAFWKLFKNSSISWEIIAQLMKRTGNEILYSIKTIIWFFYRTSSSEN